MLAGSRQSGHLDRELEAEFGREARDVEIDLINQGQILVPFGILDFVDSDGIDPAKHPVLQPEGDDVFHGVKDLFPRSAERLGRFLP